LLLVGVDEKLISQFKFGLRKIKPKCFDLFYVGRLKKAFDNGEYILVANALGQLGITNDLIGHAPSRGKYPSLFITILVNPE